jgi:hypothetical protein
LPRRNGDFVALLIVHKCALAFEGRDDQVW